MPITVLSPEELARRRGLGGVAGAYIETLSNMAPGQGGEIKVAEEGTSRQTIKNRLSQAAKATGIPISFVRSGDDLVVFAVLDAPAAPKRRGPGRPRKNPEA